MHVLRDVIGDLRRHSLGRELTRDALDLYEIASSICAGDEFIRCIEIAPEWEGRAGRELRGPQPLFAALHEMLRCHVS